MTDTLRATRPDHADTTGIYVRAVGLNGRWGSHEWAPYTPLHQCHRRR